MPETILIAAALVAITALGGVAARRLAVPESILLVVVGSALAFVPGVPRVAIDPQVVMLLFLPPLLYAAGVGMSWPGFRANLRPILFMAVGCVIATAAAVAAAAHWLVGLPLAIGFVLGAVVSPPDAVAPIAIARSLGLPERLRIVLEGEGLVNDATALILLSFAVLAVGAGPVSLPAMVGSFLLILAGELAWGISLGWLLLRVRRRVADGQIEIILSLLTPFLAFWLPHALGGSGVIAAVASGLTVSHIGPALIRPATRLQGFFVWGLVTNVIEGLLFLLTGLQAKALAGVMAGPGWQGFAVTAAITAVVIVVVRFLWVFPATAVSRLLAARHHGTGIPWRQTIFLGFTGIRGAVSLAAALSIPLQLGDAPFPQRDLILFVTFCVIIVTLVGQGSALPWLIKRLGLARIARAEAARAKAREISARVEGVEAALARLDELAAAGAPPAAVAVLRRRHVDRRAEFAGIADDGIAGNPAVEDAMLQCALIDAERARIAAVYARGAITDEARRRIERELDLEEARNRHALESASGDRLADRLADPGAAREML